MIFSRERAQGVFGEYNQKDFERTKNSASSFKRLVGLQKKGVKKDGSVTAAAEQ